MDQATELSDPNLTFWTTAFAVSAYAMAATCLYRGFRNGFRDARLWGVARELAVFALLAFLMFGVESWAHRRGAYYSYPQTFHDKVARFEFSFVASGENNDTCTKKVWNLPPETRGIPLSIVLFEASLIYAALWTARRVTRNLVAQPLFAGVSVLLVDLLLDPVVSGAKDCAGNLKPGSGIGLWTWYLPIESDLCTKSGGSTPCTERLVAHLFDVPVFNYAAWLGAPILGAAIVNLFPFLRERMRDWAEKRKHSRAMQVPVVGHCMQAMAVPRSANRDKPAGFWLVALVVVTAAGVVLSAPLMNKVPELQWTVAIAGLVAAVGSLLGHRKHFVLTRESVDAVLTLPAAIAFGLGILGAFFAGRFIGCPWLVPVAMLAPPIGLWLHWLPYRSAVEAVYLKVTLVDRFVRLHSFGFTSILILLGAGVLRGGPSTFQIGGLLFVGLCFHVFSYVTHHVVDMDQPGRDDDASQQGLAKIHVAVATAGVCIPLALMTLLFLVRFEPGRAVMAIGTFAAACTLMLFYNLARQKNLWPVVTHWAQGISWGLLTLVGAAVADREGRLAEHWGQIALLGAYGTLYIALISGVRNRSRGLHAIQLALFGVFGLFVALNHDRVLPDGSAMFAGDRLQLVVVSLCAVFGLASYLLQRLVQPTPLFGRPRRYWLALHTVLLLIPPLLVFALANGPLLIFKVVVVATTFAPLLFADWALEPLFEWIYGAAPTPLVSIAPAYETEVSGARLMPRPPSATVLAEEAVDPAWTTGDGARRRDG